MNISPDLAEKVLDADLRNEIKKVSEGGTLSPSMRAMLQASLLPGNAAKSRRIANLLTKYSSGGRLTAGELAEVREIHPEFGQDGAEQPSGPALNLTAEPSPSAGDGEVTRAQLEQWGEIYGVEHRQLRRWIARGKECGEPCPLDDLTAMPEWIEKHLQKIRGSLRDKVQSAAEAARARAPAPSPDPVSEAKTEKAEKSDGKPTPNSASLDLASVGGVEGESVELFRKLFAAVKMQLEEAYASGVEDRIRTLHSRLEKVGESLRKHEVAAEARAKRLGDYLEKVEVISEVGQALHTLSLMMEHRETRVRAELADVPPEILDRLAVVLRKVGSSEQDVLRNLGSLKSPADVSFALAA